MELRDDEEKREMIAYGLQQLKYNGICIVCICAMAAFLDILLEGCEFLLAFLPLRMYAGGYHADNRGRCFRISFLSAGFCFLLIRYAWLPNMVSCGLGIVSFWLIMSLAPVSNHTKVLEPKEVVVYGRRTRRIACIVFVVFLFLLWTIGYWVASPVLYAMVLVALSLVAGVMKY